MINIKEKMGTCGRFNLIVRKAQTNEIVRETGWFDNLVLDQGLDAMAEGGWFASCKVGTGNSSPVATQTQLDAYKALSINVQTQTQGVSSVAPYYKWSRKTFRFKAGDFNNTNLSEVAIGLDNTRNGAGIWNRALIKDGLGNPTVLTVLADEVLDVLCEIRVYQSQADINGHFNLLDKNGNIIQEIAAVIRPSKITTAKTTIGVGLAAMNAYSFNLLRAYNGDIGGITSTPSGSEVFTGNPSQQGLGYSPYVLGSHKLKFTAYYLLGDGNSAPTKSLFIQGVISDYQVSLTPAITKNATQTLNLSYSLSWGRYNP